MSRKKNIICVTPVYNDWDSFSILITEIEKVAHQLTNYTFNIIVVNDGSSESNTIKTKVSIPITTLNLKINIGHQRAIAVGLQYIYNEIDNSDFVVVLDSDGEDIPSHISLLIAKAEELESKKIIFAQRKKRQESVFF